MHEPSDRGLQAMVAKRKQSAVGRRAVLAGAAGLGIGACVGIPEAIAAPPLRSRWAFVRSLSDDFTGTGIRKWQTIPGYVSDGLSMSNPANATVSNGKLALTAKKEEYQGYGYTFGVVQSRFDIPGVNTYVEVRAKALDSHANVLSAIWMQSFQVTPNDPSSQQNDPNPEIDILETDKFTEMDSYLHTWPTSSNTGLGWGFNYYKTGVADISADYHKYGVERHDGRLRLYFDGIVVWDIVPGDSSLVNMSRHMILDLEAHLGQPDDAYLPASFLIDYVHTYYALPARPTANGRHRIVNRNSGLSLTAPASSSSNSPVTQEKWTGSGTQLWMVQRTDDMTYTLRNMATGQYLDLDGGYGQDGVAIVQGTPDTTASRQRWHVLPTDSGYVKVLSKLSGNAAAVDQASTAQGAKLIQLDYGSDRNDQWIDGRPRQSMNFLAAWPNERMTPDEKPQTI